MRWTAATPLLALAVATALPTTAQAQDPKLPLPPGRYTFEHRFAEQPRLPHAKVLVIIRKRTIQVINTQAHPPFPKGVIAQGRLVWNQPTGQWIIGEGAGDRTATEVGGCSDGPEVVDLVKRIYWTC